MPNLILENDYEERTIEVARNVLDDIEPCRKADFFVKIMSGIPFLILAFHVPETQNQPALAIQLVTVSISNPIMGGQRLEGDRLRRKIRSSAEDYLHKHGVRLPDGFLV